MGKVTDKNVIIDDLSVLYRNSVADGSWGKVSSADSKIIALTTQVNSLKAQLQGAAAGKNSGKATKSGTKPAGREDKEPSNKWRCTKVGETTKVPVTGTIVKWYSHHGTGLYMPSNHNHAKWLEKKKRKNAEGRAKKRVKFSDKSRQCKACRQEG